MALSTLVLTLALASVASAATTTGFTAYKDSQCTMPLEIREDGDSIPNNKLLADHSLADSSHASGHYYLDMEVVNATTSGSAGVGAANVYWKVPEPDSGCKFVLMREAKIGWGAMNPLPGYMVMRASREGCYYSAVSPGDTLITSYCCGSEECNKVNIEYNGNSQKRDLIELHSIEVREASTTKRSALSNAARAADVVNNKQDGTRDIALKRDDAPKCTITKKTQGPFYSSGPQRSVTQPERCDTGPASCSHTVSVSTDASTAISNSRTETWTLTGGVSIGVDVGVNFIADFETHYGLSFSVANAWATETGTTVTTGTTNGTSQTVSQQVGTLGFLSFTPVYQCWRGEANCGKDANGKDIVITNNLFCQPTLGGDGKLSGTYNMVYISDF